MLHKDLESYKKLGEIGKKSCGYPMESVYERTRAHA